MYQRFLEIAQYNSRTHRRTARPDNPLIQNGGRTCQRTHRYSTKYYLLDIIGNIIVEVLPGHEYTVCTAGFVFV